MTTPAISVRNLSKCYQLGTIGRHTLVDEVTHLWHKIRGRDPRQHMGTIGHSATQARRVQEEQKGANEFWALNNVTFDVQAGEVIGIIGRNGAGKSTLLKILTRITEPTSGDAFINGRVASLLEVGTGFHPELTGRENVYMNGTILGMKKREISAKFDEIVAFSELEKFIDTPVKRYSSGMYVRLAFAVAAHLETNILLVDEVLAVGDMNFQRKCIDRMSELAKSGRTVLFVSHQMNAVRHMCTRCLLIAGGSVEADGTPSVVVTQYEIGRINPDSIHGKINENNTSKQVIAFTEWYIRGQQGEGKSHVVNDLNEVVIEAEIRLRCGVTHAFCGLALRDDNRTLICSWVQHGINLISGTARVRFTLPMLPVRPGLYHLQFSLHDDHSRLDLWDAVPPLRVDTLPQAHPRDEWTGILNMPAKMCFMQEAPPENLSVALCAERSSQ